MKRNRKHKDRVFTLAFKAAVDQLDLYNSLTGSHYTNPDDLEIITLDDVIYMHMKNDMSLLIDNQLNLWEQQSTYNPNMPVRGLSYFAKLYQKYIERKGINIFSSSLKHLPFPQYFVFYNGRRDEPDQKELLLSDAFMAPSAQPDGQPIVPRKPCLEVRATMLNINYGHNRELMERCKRLREYAQFIARIREYLDGGTGIDEALDQAVNDCIREGILEDILSEHKAEVITMFLTEYDEERHMAMEREDGKAEGLMKGQSMKVIQLVRRKFSKNMAAADIADLLEEDASTVQEICGLIRLHPDWDDEAVYRGMGAPGLPKMP